MKNDVCISEFLQVGTKTECAAGAAYLHGVLAAVHSVLRAGDRGAVAPVQMELHRLIGLVQTST